MRVTCIVLCAMFAVALSLPAEPAKPDEGIPVKMEGNLAAEAADAALNNPVKVEEEEDDDEDDEVPEDEDDDEDDDEVDEENVDMDDEPTMEFETMEEIEVDDEEDDDEDDDEEEAPIEAPEAPKV